MIKKKERAINNWSEFLIEKQRENIEISFGDAGSADCVRGADSFLVSSGERILAAERCRALFIDVERNGVVRAARGGKLARLSSVSRSPSGKRSERSLDTKNAHKQTTSNVAESIFIPRRDHQIAVPINAPINRPTLSPFDLFSERFFEFGDTPTPTVCSQKYANFIAIFSLHNISSPLVHYLCSATFVARTRTIIKKE